MSAKVIREGFVLSALQPNTLVTTYAVPSDAQLGQGGALSDEAAKAKRVQQQVQMCLAEKLSSLSRRNNSRRAFSDYGDSTTRRYHNQNSQGFSSVSLVYNGNQTRASSGGFSSRSALETGTGRKISQGRGNSSYLWQDDMYLDGHHTNRQTTRTRTMTQAEKEMLSIGQHNLSQKPSSVASWVARATSGSHEGGSVASPMQRSLSGTLIRGSGRGWHNEELVDQNSFKGPSHRTINRITNRQQQQNRMSSGTLQWQQLASGGSSVLGGVPNTASLRRATSLHSMKSVGKGMDVCDEADWAKSYSKTFAGMHSLDMDTAVSYLSASETAMQVLGAAYIQHQCYHSSSAKDQVRHLKGVPALVKLFSNDSQEVQRYATGAMRNLIYENMDNKSALIEADGLGKLTGALSKPDEELRKNITGILWNLSSKDSLKEKLARETLGELTDKVLVPLSSGGDVGVIQQSVSESDIFYNTMGCFRNLSSVNKKTRQQMRERPGLVDSLVVYIQNSLHEGKGEDKGVENAVCVLRNLSYQLYSELPPSVLLQLDGPTRGRDSYEGGTTGCFTPQSMKSKKQWNQQLSTFTEVEKQPKGAEWLWHPQVVGLYNLVLRHCETNAATREAAVGALQNITAGETRWASVLSWVALDKERILPVVLDLLRTQNDQELRSVTGLLRNLSRHSTNKADMATKVVNIVVTKLPCDGYQKEPSAEVVVNICGVLNNLVTDSSIAARDITFFNGIPKLVAIKGSHDSTSEKLKASKAASTVLCNMFQYSKLHKEYKQKGFTRRDFTE